MQSRPMTGEESPSTRLGERVRDARRARSWSQGELATQAGVSRATIARLEAGKHVFMGTMETVAQALRLELDLRPD